ncbi:MAG TPA: DUF5615 family PIN-like protein [Tepidisphaeraceae bacterium]|nr:DUF5615 family PIN-like protein [Tepidisphaeraceae bacterium]
MKLLADENLSYVLVRALRRERPGIDLITVRDAGLAGTKDPLLLQIAAERDLVILSHDVQTLVGFANDRVAAGLAMSGLIVIPSPFHVIRTVEDILLLIDCSLEGELDGQIRFVPL